jgi:hypothetical protein
LASLLFKSAFGFLSAIGVRVSGLTNVSFRHFSAFSTFFRHTKKIIHPLSRPPPHRNGELNRIPKNKIIAAQASHAA